MRNQSIPRAFGGVFAVLGLVGAAACSSGAEDAAQPALPETREPADPPGSSAPDAPAGSDSPVGTPGNGEVTAPVGAPLDPQTPAEPDSAAETPTMAGDIRFSEPSGTFEGSLSVSIESPIEGAVIRYTTDGSVPSASSPTYDGNPVLVNDTRQLRA